MPTNLFKHTRNSLPKICRHAGKEAKTAVKHNSVTFHKHLITARCLDS